MAKKNGCKSVLLKGAAISLILLCLTIPSRAEVSKDYIIAVICNYADEYGIDRQLALDIARAESSLCVKAVGGVGERGLYQHRLKVWKWISKELYNKNISFDRAFEVELNIEFGMWHLAFLKRYLGKHYTMARLVCAYNSGIGTLKNNNYRVPSSHKNKIYNRYYMR